MAKENIATKIYNYISESEKIHFTSIENFADTIPCKHETAFRKCRDLVRNGNIDKFDKDGDLIPIEDKSTTIYFYKRRTLAQEKPKPIMFNKDKCLETLTQPTLFKLKTYMSNATDKQKAYIANIILSNQDYQLFKKIAEETPRNNDKYPDTRCNYQEIILAEKLNLTKKQAGYFLNSFNVKGYSKQTAFKILNKSIS